MKRTLKEFDVHRYSRHHTAAPVYNIGTHGEPLYAVFLYAEHHLYKVIAVGPYLSEAQDVADIIAVRFSNRPPDVFATWVQAEFPGDVCHLEPDRIAALFA